MGPQVTSSQTHRVWDPLTHNWWPDDSDSHQQIAKRFWGFACLHKLYAVLGGQHSAELDDGPFELQFTIWGVMPLPERRPLPAAPISFEFTPSPRPRQGGTA